MGLFGRKKGPEIIDFSDMQKRGLLPAGVPKADEQGVVDFSSVSQTQTGLLSEGNSGSGGDDFLSNLAGVGARTEPSEVQPSPGPVTSSLRLARQKGQLDKHVNEMRLKIDDNEYKIRKLSERVMELEEKLRRVGGGY